MFDLPVDLISDSTSNFILHLPVSDQLGFSIGSKAVNYINILKVLAQA